MADLSTPSSLTAKLRPIEVGGAVASAHFIGTVPAFVLGEGAVVLAGSETQRIEAHTGAILAAAVDARRLLTGGDDGRVVATRGDGATETLAAQNGRWIDQVAAGPDGAVAWSAGRTAFVRTGKGELKSLDVASTVGGLSFAPKGLRLAVAHYGGASLWFPNAAAPPEALQWKGSHRGVLWHPEGRFLVTTMQEAALHGWRLPDGAHMRMTGYPARVRSMGFTVGGRFLATSGSNELVLWPFASKDGPMGKSPLMLAPRNVRIAAVAAHPRDEVVACGFEDGLVLMVRISDGAEILLRAPAGSPVSALAWRADGRALAIGTESGQAGLLDL